MFGLKIFITKAGKRCACLCYKRGNISVPLTYERSVIVEVLDIKPSALSEYDVGFYEFDGESLMGPI